MGPIGINSTIYANSIGRLLKLFKMAHAECASDAGPMILFTAYTPIRNINPAEATKPSCGTPPSGEVRSLANGMRVGPNARNALVWNRIRGPGACSNASSDIYIGKPEAMQDKELPIYQTNLFNVNRMTACKIIYL